VRGSTLALWLIPVGAAVIGVLLVGMRRRRREDVPELSAEDRAQVASAVARLRATGEPEEPL
jgi:cytochrome c-type biogenesis protein CcmH/NrfF